MCEGEVPAQQFKRHLRLSKVLQVDSCLVLRACCLVIYDCDVSGPLAWTRKAVYWKTNLPCCQVTRLCVASTLSCCMLMRCEQIYSASACFRVLLSG